MSKNAKKRIITAKKVVKVPIMMDKIPFSENTISVSEVNATIKACIDSPIFKGLEVFGEVSGFKFSGQHAYFTLKDKNSQISCVCFYAAKTYSPKDGESVIVRGGVDYYVKGGRLSLQVTSITPIGQGLLFLEFERLKARLSAEGLFDEVHKIPLPKYAENILVITSKTGAVIRDIVTTIRRKNPIMNISVRDVRVQGEGAGKEIAAVLGRVDALGYDVIILARGGGSLEDLAPFYDEELVRAIYRMNTPIVSAIGHETDFSLADFVADMRAPTPTAAGELVAYDYYALKQQLIDITQRLPKIVADSYEKKSKRAQLACEQIRRTASSFYDDRARSVERSIVNARVAIDKIFAAADHRLALGIDTLDKLSPLKILKRGYFRITKDGAGVANVGALRVGDNIKMTGGDGWFKADVKEIEMTEEK